MNYIVPEHLLDRIKKVLKEIVHRERPAEAEEILLFINYLEGIPTLGDKQRCKGNCGDKMCECHVAV